MADKQETSGSGIAVEQSEPAIINNGSDQFSAVQVEFYRKGIVPQASSHRYAASFSCEMDISGMYSAELGTCPRDPLGISSRVDAHYSEGLRHRRGPSENVSAAW